MIYLNPDFFSGQTTKFKQGDIFHRLPYLALDAISENLSTQWNDFIIQSQDEPPERPLSFPVFPVEKEGILLNQDCDIREKKYLLFAVIRRKTEKLSHRPISSANQKLKIVRDETRYHYLPPYLDEEDEENHARIVDFTNLFIVPKKCLDTNPDIFLLYHMKDEPKRIFAEKIARFFSRLPYEDMWFLNDAEREAYKEKNNMSDEEMGDRLALLK